jgi:hypothetical protein
MRFSDGERPNKGPHRTRITEALLSSMVRARASLISQEASR